MPFRFENTWLKAKNFSSLIRTWWLSTKIVGSNSFVLMKKMKALKCTEVVKDDVMRMFNEFHASRKFVKSLNTFLVMIPRGGGGGGFLLDLSGGKSLQTAR